MFSGGIAAAEWLVFPPAFLWVLWAGFALALAASVWLFRCAQGLAVFYVMLFAGGMLARGLAGSQPQRNHLRWVAGGQPQSLSVRAVIVEEPVRRVHRAARGDREREYFFAEVEAINRGAMWQSASGQLAVRMDQPDPNERLRYGDRIEFAALLRQPQPPANPGQFNYQKYLARRGVFHEARIASAAEVAVTGHERSWLMEWGMWLQRRFLDSAGRGLEEAHVGDEPTIAGLLRAMLVGYRPGLTHELAEPFMRTGTLHVFAVSGLHVAVIAGIFVVLLQALRVPRRAHAMVAVPLLLIYTIATGAPASAVRAFLMAGVVIIGWSLPRPTDLLNSIAAAALAVLLWNPLQLFDVGFQLSFAVVIALAVLVPGAGMLHRALYHRPHADSDTSVVPHRWLGGVADWLVRDPYLPEKLLPWWRRRWYGAVHAVYVSIAVSVAACLGSLPLIAHYFHLVTPVNFLSNVVIVPLSSVTIIIGFASFLADLVWTGLAVWLNNANYMLMKLMLWFTEGFERLPAAFFYVREAPPWLAAGYYLAGALFLYPPLWRRASRAAWAGVTAAAVLAVGLAARNGDQTATLTALSVGDGSALFLNLPREGRDTLIDCGGWRDADFAVQPFLRSQGCDRIETLILTHADASHVGGLPKLLPALQPRRIYDNGNTRWTRTLIEPLPPYQPLRLTAGASVPLAEGVELRVLHPPVGRLARVGDDAALVMQLRCGLHRVLLMSDAGETVERKLLADKTDLRSDVLIKGLHSREESCSDEFLDAVAAQWVVVSCGGFAPGRTMSAEMLDRLGRHNAVVLRTDEHGAVTVRMTPGGLEVKSCFSAPPAVLSSAPREPDRHSPATN